MRAPRFLAAAAALLIAVLPVRADQVLGPGRILGSDPGNGDILFGTLKLGKRQGGQTVFTPDAVTTSTLTLGGVVVNGIGTTAGTIAAGNDSRLLNALQSGGAGTVSGMSLVPTRAGLPTLKVSDLAGSEIQAAWYGFSPTATGAQNALALNNAIAAAKGLLAGGMYDSATVVLPAGTFTLDGTYKFGRDGLSIGLRGAGRDATVINATNTVPDVPTFDYDFADPAQSLAGASIQARVSVTSLTVNDYVNGNNARSRLNSTVSVRNAGSLRIHDVRVNSIGGRGIVLDGVIALDMRSVQAESYNNTALDLRGVQSPISGRISGSRFRVLGIGGPTAMQGPPVRVSGTVTGLIWDGNRIGGAGPRVQQTNALIYLPGSGEIQPVITNPITPDGYAVASITSSTTTVTVNTVKPHSFAAGDTVGLYGVAGPYSKFWTVASVPSATQVTFSVSSDPGNAAVTANTVIGRPPYSAGDTVVIQGAAPSVYNGRYVCLGMADTQTVRLAATRPDGVTPTGTVTSAGTTSSYFAGLLVDNEYGPVNESQFTSGLIESVNEPVDKTLDGSFAVVIDASRSNSARMYSNMLGIEKLDGGHSNLMIVGHQFQNGRAPSELSVKVGRGISPGDNILVSGPSGKVSISDFIGVAQAGKDDAALGRSAALRITGRPDGAPLALTVNGGQLGLPLYAGTATGPSFPYAILFDGAAPNGDQAQLVSVSGTALAGNSTPVGWINGADPSAQDLKIDPGSVISGAWPTNFSGELAPAGVAANGVLPLPVYGKPFRVYGQSGNVTTITGVWKGRSGSFIVDGTPLTVATGGNIAASATFPVGSWVNFVYRGGVVYLK